MTSLAGGSWAYSCLGARGGRWFRRLCRSHPFECDLVGGMLALELITLPAKSFPLAPITGRTNTAISSSMTVVCGGTSMRSRNGNPRLCAFEITVQDEHALVAVVGDVSREPHLHHRLGVLAEPLPRIAPRAELRLSVDVELGLALQPVADALRYRIQDQRERLKQRLDDGLDRARLGRRNCHLPRILTGSQPLAESPGISLGVT